MKNVVTWFEIPVKNMNRAQQFYSDILQMDLTQIEQGKQRMVVFPFDGDNVSGSLVSADDQDPGQSGNGVCIFLNAGEELQPAVDRVTEAGGEILVEKIEIESGVISYIRDTEGNKVGLYAQA